MIKYSRLAETLIGSEIVKLGGIIRERVRQGIPVFNFTIGDFDSSIFPIPEKLRDEIIRAYQDGFTTYPAADGEPELREAVRHFLQRKLGLDYAADEVLISNGGRPLIYAIYRCLVDKGDKVIYPVPSWNNNHYTHFTEGEHITIPASRNHHFMPSAEQLEPYLKDATLLALCSPLNPTGTVFTEETLGAICDQVLAENARRGPGQKKLYVLYDQIYWTLTFGDTRHVDPVSLRPEMKPYTVYVDGISKAFASTGVRVGWTMGPKELIAKIKAVNSHVGSWAPMAEQKATARFLSDSDAVDQYLHAFRQAVERRLRGLYDGFMQLRNDGFPVDAIAPQAAIYLTVQADLRGKRLPDDTLIETQEQATAYLLEAANLAMVPFGYFGADRNSSWYRISVGCCRESDIPAVIQSLRGALLALR